MADRIATTQGRAAAPAGPAPVDVATVTLLQRSAGNAAVSRLLQRAPATVPEAPGETAERPTGPLLPEERARIETQTTGLVTLAFTAFSRACDRHSAAMKTIAKDRAEVTALFVDVVTAGFAPAFAAWIDGSLMRAAAKELSKETVGKLGTFLTEKDTVKTWFTWANKEVNALIKLNADNLAGETDHDAFVRGLAVAFHSGAAYLIQNLGPTKLSDEQLLAVWYGYGFEYTNETVYAEAIGELLSQYEAFVDAQGTRSTENDPNEVGNQIDSTTRACYANSGGRRHTMLVREVRRGEFFERTFVDWVSPALAELAAARSEQLFGSVPTITLEDLDGPSPPPPDA
jgi:hypothetical protein